MSYVAVMPYEDYEAACDAIRIKTGTSDLIKSGEMAGLIEGIEGSGNAETCVVRFPESPYIIRVAYTDASGKIKIDYVSNGTSYDGITVNAINVQKNSFIIFVNNSAQETDSSSNVGYLNGWHECNSDGSGYGFINPLSASYLIKRGSNYSTENFPIALFVANDITFGYSVSDKEPT